MWSFHEGFSSNNTPKNLTNRIFLYYNCLFEALVVLVACHLFY